MGDILFIDSETGERFRPSELEEVTNDKAN